MCTKFLFLYSLVESCGFNQLSHIKYISQLLVSLCSLDATADKRMYYFVIVNYKTMKIEELKYHQDSMMEINSCIKCLGDFYTFASDRLRYYQEINKHKGNVDLLNLMEPGDESSDEIREVYIERQYWGYCKHLQEYMENAGHELDDLSPKLGLKHKMQSRTPDLGLLNVKLWNCTTFYRSIKMMKIICL